MKILYAAALIAALPASTGVAAEPAPVAASASAAIEEPVAAMLDAITKLDAAAVGEALSRTVEPEIVYYWGETVSGRDAIVQWHREWFAETGWRIEPGAVGHSLVGDKLATLTAPVRYIKTPERQFLILISYTLLKEADGWKIARIQQTLLEGPE